MQKQRMQSESASAKITDVTAGVSVEIASAHPKKCSGIVDATHTGHNRCTWYYSQFTDLVLWQFTNLVLGQMSQVRPMQT